jgi:small basic protein (TIGR04137 family)
MSIHRSLSLKEKEKRSRSVLKRIERIKILMDKGVFKKESSSCFGLPKVKVLKIKIKKGKAKETPTPTPTPSP